MGGAMNRTIAEVFPPGEYIKEELEARGWTQAEFAEILGRPPRLVSEIITGKRSISPETARGLAAAFGTTPQLWMNLESSYQLSRVKNDDSAVARRARLYEKAPVKEMVRRRWIEASSSVDVLEKRVFDFFGLKSIDEEPIFWPYAARMSTPYITLTPPRRAWLFRARHLAHAVDAAKFSEAKFKAALGRLHLLLRDAEEARHVPKVLAEAGIRFLVLEHLPQTRLDGACFWLNDTSPVVVLSLRFDRIDCFWHTLMHELGHVLNRHGLHHHEPVDADLVGKDSLESRRHRPQLEIEVDEFASDALIPRAELDDFIARISPLYSKAKIKGFAARVGIHPGIVVGQLQFREEIDYAHSREMLVPVRDIVTQAALTDGWGQPVPAVA